jgi:predicted 3-demethylubiquinone-9 3-methyltransferase (glyoxalase superfamily)
VAQSISPFLWFDTQAEDAANFYVSIFKNSRIVDISRYGEGSPFPAGTALVVNFELDGLQMRALNAGPGFPFTDAISFQIDVESQDEVDYLWDTLTSDGGAPGQCGWLKDRFGLSWQVVPELLSKLLGDPNPEKAVSVMRAMMLMTKIEIPLLQAAYDAV